MLKRRVSSLPESGAAPLDARTPAPAMMRKNVVLKKAMRVAEVASTAGIPPA